MYSAPHNFRVAKLSDGRLIPLPNDFVLASAVTERIPATYRDLHHTIEDYVRFISKFQVSRSMTDSEYQGARSHFLSKFSQIREALKAYDLSDEARSNIEKHLKIFEKNQ